MWNPLNWLKTSLIEKWIGRVIVIGLAALGGVLIEKLNLPADLVNGWLEATKALLEALLPILIAWILGSIRFNTALNKVPPVK